jgi:putative spermidine/putrescine transport system ATP-binding protein
MLALTRGDTMSGPSAGSAVHIEGVSKSYGDFLAVPGLDLEVRSGEFLTLLGPSGSGKTTTLMMIAGFETPSAGRIFINGKDCTQIPPYRRNLSMVFQNYALFPHRTVARNVAFPLEMRRRSAGEIEAAVAEALAMVRLTGLENRLPTQLSGGQQQRVALARAIGFGPSILLMDEPLGALDKNLREQVQMEIKEIQRRLGVTVVYVTHDQHEALTMSDRIVVMNQGRIEQIASPETMYQSPANRFVAGFLGASNFIEVSLDEVKADGAFVASAGEGLTIRGRSGRARAGGATIAIRPERVALLPAGTESAGLEMHRGVVTSAVFTGDSLSYSVRVGRIDLSVKVPNTGRVYRPSVDEEVNVSWSDEDLSVLTE